MVKSYYKTTQTYYFKRLLATTNLLASFFEYRTRLNNNGFLIK